MAERKSFYPEKVRKILRLIKSLEVRPQHLANQLEVYYSPIANSICQC